MELRHLRYFVAVALEENVTRASAALRVAQPSLSRQIRDLECELGFPLFEREAKSIRLTEAGRHFLEECQAILRQVEEGVERARAVAEGRTGEVRVGFAPSLTVELIPKVLRAFSASMPGGKVQLHDLSTREILTGLREEKLDVGLLVHPGRGALQGLEFHELQSFECSVAVSLDHPLAQLAKVPLEKIVAQPMMVYSRAEYPEYHDWIAPIVLSSIHPPTQHEHQSATTLIAAVEAGHGVAIVQSELPSYTGNRLKVLPIDPPQPPLMIGAVHRKGGASVACRKFVEVALGCR